MKQRREMLKNYKKYLAKIYSSSKEILKDSKLYIFGSVIEGKNVGGSDIDLLIIANVPKNHLIRTQIIANIEEKAGLPLSHPFEIHLLSSEEFKIWKRIYNLKFKDISFYL
jgi:predicted nucleotidyltransferase